ncbi:hypothetical protein [Pseudomonas phage PA7]|uniref:Uncharacterized protein n=1 Tax=Pseudomonas phage PA7 TaxID=347330 RepID=A0AAE7V910_9CAUD|nr:hypothetical protein [Pseudomonas phage PA7]
MAKTLVRAKLITEAGQWMSSDWERGFRACRFVKLGNAHINIKDFESIITTFEVGDMLVIWPNGLRTSYSVDNFNKYFSHIKDEYYETDFRLLFYPK